MEPFTSKNTYVADGAATVSVADVAAGVVVCSKLVPVPACVRVRVRVCVGVCHCVFDSKFPFLSTVRGRGRVRNR